MYLIRPRNQEHLIKLNRIAVLTAAASIAGCISGMIDSVHASFGGHFYGHFGSITGILSTLSVPLAMLSISAVLLLNGSFVHSPRSGAASLLFISGMLVSMTKPPVSSVGGSLLLTAAALFYYSWYFQKKAKTPLDHFKLAWMACIHLGYSITLWRIYLFSFNSLLLVLALLGLTCLILLSTTSGNLMSDPPFDTMLQRAREISGQALPFSAKEDEQAN